MKLPKQIKNLGSTPNWQVSYQYTTRFPFPSKFEGIIGSMVSGKMPGSKSSSKEKKGKGGEAATGWCIEGYLRHDAPAKCNTQYRWRSNIYEGKYQDACERARAEVTANLGALQPDAECRGYIAIGKCTSEENCGPAGSF